MMTFLGKELTEKEERYVTSVIIGLSNGDKVTDADVLHKILEYAEIGEHYSYTVEQAKRTNKFKNDDKSEDYKDGFSKCLDIIK